MYARLPRYSFGQSSFAPVPNLVTRFSIIVSISSSNLKTRFVASIFRMETTDYIYINIHKYICYFIFTKGA